MSTLIANMGKGAGLVAKMGKGSGLTAQMGQGSGLVANMGITGSTGICDEYQTVYDAFTTPPSAAIAAEQNTFVKTIVASGVWAKLDVLYVYAQSTNAGGEALLDWKQPTGGSELNTDPNFSDTDLWTKGAGWTVSGGVAIHAGGDRDNISLTTPPDSNVVGKTYKITINIVSRPVANSYLRVYAPSLADYTNDESGTGVKSFLHVCTNATEGFTFRADGDLQISQFSVTEWTNATAYNSPTFTALEGFTGNGTTQYIDCNARMDLLTNYVLDDSSMGCYIRNNVDEAKHVIGANDGTDYLHLQLRNSDVASWTINDDGTDDTGANTDSTGIYIINRTASDERALYRNNVEIAADAQASVGLVGQNLFVLARNENATAGSFSTNQASMAYAGASLTSGDRAGLQSAFEVYMDSNSKGVIA